MDLHLEQQHIPCFRPSVSRTAEERFSADSVVPDSLPDVGSLLLAEGDLCLWRLDVSDGNAELEGEISARVCCAPETGGDPVSFPVSVPLQMHLRGEDFVSGLRPFLRCRITELTAHLLNSRKIRLQGRFSCELTGYMPWELTLTTGLGSGEHGLFVRRSPASLPVVTAVEEQVFTTAETVPLRMGFPAEGRLLSHSSVPVLEETQLLDGRVILRGKVVSTLLYRDAERGALVTEAVETPFSQLMDAGDGTATEAWIALNLTSAELRCLNDEQAVETEFHLVAQTVCFSLIQMECVTDAYSNLAPLSMEWEDLDLSSRVGGEQERRYAEGTAACELAGRTVAAARAIRRGEKAVVTVLLSDGDGNISAQTGELPLDVPAGSEVDAELPTVLPGPEGLSLRLPFMIRRAETQHHSFRRLASAVLEESGGMDVRPGVTLVRREESADLWTLAKENASSEAAIRAANPETDTPGRWIVIPKVV